MTLAPYVVPNGMARSVFDNKYSRRKPNGSMQTWEERLTDVVQGNFSLEPSLGPEGLFDYNRTLELAIAGIMPTAGRHLQHGDLNQRDRLLELHSNCSSAMTSFMLMRLALRGSGIGRDYSSEICRVNWDNMPEIRLVMDSAHADFRHAEFMGSLEPLREARHKYDSESENVRWFDVADSREGWAKIVEILETAAWQEKHKDKLFIFNFSEVRPQGSPIAGLQNRPASGPVPLMNALLRMATIKGAGMKPWKQALFIDHYLAECVVWGGARRVARMAMKSWRDRDVIEFIDIKRGGFLWSANNSVAVDAEFWEKAKDPRPSHARRVFEAAASAAYWDKTGEPGFVNVDKLHDDRSGSETITGETLINQKTYVDLHPRTRDMLDNMLAHVKTMRYQFITNPCGEITLASWGALCIIGEVNLARVQDLDDARDAARLMAQFLVRLNLMDADYAAEVARTNRIGVGLTGVHEFAWNCFGLTFYDMIRAYDIVFDESGQPNEISGHGLDDNIENFWNFIGRLRTYAESGANETADRLGLVRPHTVTTVKPSGTVSKVMACTEGVHLPATAYYLRWVQYLIGDPDLEKLRARGYPVKDISHRYSGHMAVGFPTVQPIAEIMGDTVTMADQASPEDQFKWLRLLEHFWLGPDRGNQVSYTLKYDSTKTTFIQFMDMLLEWQSKVKCCSVMPASDWRKSAEVYGYVPEEPISREEYHALMAYIDPVSHESYSEDDMLCEGGVCPIEPDVNKVGFDG